MSKSSHQSPLKVNASPRGWLRALVLVLAVISTLAGAFVWFIPIDVVQQWALDRSGAGAFDQFEAVGQAQCSVWMARLMAPLILAIFWRTWWNWDRVLSFLGDVLCGLAAITSPVSLGHLTRLQSLANRVRTIGCRAILVAWTVLFAFHFVDGIGRCIHDWPFFRFNSGELVLPNISESNRAVIRYIDAATPPKSRILVASDQKLFFLSYYLRPRTLFHRMHPDSEHVIPLKDQQRKLLAYRLDELSVDDLRQMPHEYTLEYFEHPDFVDRSRVLEDAKWVEFIRRQTKNRSLVPSYVVRLKRVEGQE